MGVVVWTMTHYNGPAQISVGNLWNGNLCVALGGGEVYDFGECD